MARRGVLRALVLPCLAVHGMLESGSVDFREGASPWLLMAKFGYGYGRGTYQIRIKSNEPVQNVSLIFELYLDEDWEKAEKLDPCARSVDGPARKTMPLSGANEFSEWRRGSLVQSVRPHIWYFALSGCGLEANATVAFDYELKAFQGDKSELSFEFRYMPVAVLIALLCLTGAIARFAVRCWKFHQRVGALHPVLHGLASAMVLHWIAQLLRLAHLRSLEHDGMGSPSIEAVAGMLCMLSQVISSALLIIIAQGYTLPGFKGDELGGARVIVAATGLVHVTLIGHDKLTGSRIDKHHELEGVHGGVILVLRFALYAWFLLRIRVLRQSGGFKLQDFLGRFQIAGSLHFLSYPLLVAVVQLFAPYLRHPILQTGLVVMQLASACWLSDLFLSKSMYYEISTLSSSPLPATSCASFKLD